MRAVPCEFNGTRPRVWEIDAKKCIIHPQLVTGWRNMKHGGRREHDWKERETTGDECHYRGCTTGEWDDD